MKFSSLGGKVLLVGNEIIMPFLALCPATFSKLLLQMLFHIIWYKEMLLLWPIVDTLCRSNLRYSKWATMSLIFVVSFSLIRLPLWGEFFQD